MRILGGQLPCAVNITTYVINRLECCAWFAQVLLPSLLGVPLEHASGSVRIVQDARVKMSMRCPATDTVLPHWG